MSSTHGQIGRTGAAGHDDHPGHYMPQVLTKTPPEISREILAATRKVTPRYKLALAVTGGLLILGIIGFAIRLSDGFEKFTPWAYTMATFAFILSTAAAAPIVSVGQRMIRSHWRRPLGRAAELFAVAGILSTLLFIPLLLVLPSADNRRSIWFEYPGAPHVYQIMGVVGLAVLGLALLWVAAIPDLAARRDLDEPGAAKSWAARLSLNFRGTPRQWSVLRAGLRALGALYFMFYIWIVTIVAADFAHALIPGYKDAIFPAHQALNGLQCGLAATLVAAFLLKKFGGYNDFLTVDQFWSASKILLALSLLWAYFWASAFMIYWYGRQPQESVILRIFYAESYRVPFLISFFMLFLVPFLGLMWNNVRKSILGPVIVSCSILIGSFFDKVRVYVAAFQQGDVRADALHELHPPAISEVTPPLIPHAPDLMIIAGAIGGVIFLYLLAAKFIPPVSIWEVSEGTLYRKTVKFLKRSIMVMGKPE